MSGGPVHIGKRGKIRSPKSHEEQRVIKANPSRSMTRLPQQYNMSTIIQSQVTGKRYGHDKESYHDQNQDFQASEDLGCRNCKRLLKQEDENLQEECSDLFQTKKLSTINLVFNSKNTGCPIKKATQAFGSCSKTRVPILFKLTMDIV